MLEDAGCSLGNFSKCSASTQNASIFHGYLLRKERNSKSLQPKLLRRRARWARQVSPLHISNKRAEMLSIAEAGLDAIAPNLLLLLVLQEFHSDVPTLSAENAPFGRAFAPDFQGHSAHSTSPAPARTTPYNIELETPPVRSDGGADESLTPNLERSQS